MNQTIILNNESNYPVTFNLTLANQQALRLDVDRLQQVGVSLDPADARQEVSVTAHLPSGQQQQLGTRVASADNNELTVADGVAWSEAAFGAPNPLPLTMQVQQMSNWCWAATSSSINDFYFGGTDLDNTQDKLVGKAFQGTCLIAPRSQACDRPNTIDAGLILTNRYTATLGGNLAWSAIQSQIDAKQPIAVGIVSTGGGVGHMLALIGYGKSANIIVKDPAIGDAARVVALAGFPGNLYTNYNWTISATSHA